MAREPEYDHKKWEQEWEENQAYMDSIAQYPRDWWKEEKVRCYPKTKHSDKRENGNYFYFKHSYKITTKASASLLNICPDKQLFPM